MGAKQKKKTIPININSNPAPGKFLISNSINPIASSYLSMGQKIQISKNKKYPRIIQVNTNSAVNYYTLNSKDSKRGNGSITNNYSSNNTSYNNGINFNNYRSNNHSQQHNEASTLDKNIIKYNNININPKSRKHLSTISNTIIANDILMNGYQTSKNNNSNLLNDFKPKNKITNTNSKTNLSKYRQTYSTRPNFLDSKNKTKKMPMKSKIRQFKYQYKNNKPISSSFSNVHLMKNNYQEISLPREKYNCVRVNLLNNVSNENKNIFEKHITNANYSTNNNLYEIKNKHYRHNTASFDNKNIINIFNKKNINTLNLDSSNNINSIAIKANYNNKKICINNIDYNNKNKNRNSLNKNNIINNNNNENIINKKTVGNNRKNNQLSKGKINDIKIYTNEKKINQKELNTNQNINNIYLSNNIYQNYHNNTNSNGNNAIKYNYNTYVQHTKNSNSINKAIPGPKRINIKQKEFKRNNIIQNQSKLINKQILPNQKMKGNIIPSQRNIKINLAKILQDVKSKPNNNNNNNNNINSKFTLGRKSLSIKRMSKENNSDFLLSQLNDKFTQKVLKNNEEGNDIGNYMQNKRQNNNKAIQDEIKEKLKKRKIDENKINQIDNNMLINTNFISNIQKNQNRKKNNRTSNLSSNKINDIFHNPNITNNSNYYNLNNNNNNSIISTNNYYYGKNKNDYSVDNISDVINTNNKDYLKNKENINDINLNNITEVNNVNANYKNININNNRKYNNNLNKNELSLDNKTITNNISEDINISKNDEINTNDKKLIENNINNNLFDEENLDELPDDYDENFNDLYSIINRMNFGNVLVCVEGLFTPEGRTYKKYKDKFDKFYDKLFYKKGNSFANSNNKPKKIMEGISLTSNTKTNSSSSKKNIINPMYNDLNIVKDLNIY